MGGSCSPLNAWRPAGGRSGQVEHEEGYGAALTELATRAPTLRQLPPRQIRWLPRTGTDVQ